MFAQWIEQAGGYLPNVPQAHALMYYAMQAARMQTEEVKDIVLEGDPDPVRNYVNLIKSVARWYSVSVDQMISCWPFVDKQMEALEFPRVRQPARFDNTIGGGGLPTIIT